MTIPPIAGIGSSVVNHGVATIMGFGAIDSSGFVPLPDFLQVGVVNVVPRRDCRHNKTHTNLGTVVTLLYTSIQEKYHVDSIKTTMVVVLSL